MSGKVPERAMIEQMKKITLAEYRGWQGVGAWAKQAAAEDDQELAEILEVVSARERDNSFIFRYRLQQLGETLDLPEPPPPGAPFSAVGRLRGLYATEGGYKTLDTVGEAYRAEEAAAITWPNHERYLMWHYLFTERHSTMILLDAWIKRDREAALASPRYGEYARTRTEAPVVGWESTPIGMGPIGQNLDNWSAPYR